MKVFQWFVEKNIKDDLMITHTSLSTYLKMKEKWVLITLMIEILIELIGSRFLIMPPWRFYLYLMGVILVYKMPYFFLKNASKRKAKQVYDDFPLWLSSLEILILSHNIPNTLKASLATCPKSLREDLSVLVEKLETDPTNQEAYISFLSQYHFPDIHEMMLDLYQFNFLNKSLMIKEFSTLHKRLNHLEASQRQHHQEQSLFFIGAINSVPLFLLSIYILLMANMLSNVLMGG